MHDVRSGPVSHRRLMVFLALFAGLVTFVDLLQDQAASRLPASIVLPKAGQKIDPRLPVIVGHWEDDYRGKRFLTLRGDGTAIMIVEPEGLGKVLFARELKFNIQWKLENDLLYMLTLDGQPATKVQLILKMYGNQAAHKIEEVTHARMVLVDAKDATRYEWRRSAAR